jgi:RimJ/RimL family protein N-acetyltransferase
MRFEALNGPRVALRVVQDADVAGVEAWYYEAASAGYQEMSFEELRRSDGYLLAVARPDRDEPIGLLAYEVKGGWLTVRFIALAKAYRGWGYGSEAVRLVEEWAVRDGVAERIRAEVDVRNGLGLYFWLRLGYRPAAVREFDWPSDDSRDMMPMVRV